MIILPSLNCGILNSNFFVKKDLVLHVDSSNINCYTKLGTSCKNLANLNETGSLNMINFINNSFETQDPDSYISFNKNFTASNSQASFFIVFEIPNFTFPLDNYYDIIGSFGNLLYGYNFNFIRFSSNSSNITINWEIYNSFGLGNSLSYDISTSSLPKRICVCGTLNNNSLNLYINGYLYSSSVVVFPDDYNFYNFIHAGAMNHIAGTQTSAGLIIYEYLIYKRGILASEVLQNYNTIKLKYNLN